jgi:hypothetical protein
MTAGNVMPQDIHCAVIGPNLEIAMVGRQPAIDHLIHLDAPLTQPEAPGGLFAAVTAVAFDMNSFQGIVHGTRPACLSMSAYYSNG